MEKTPKKDSENGAGLHSFNEALSAAKENIGPSLRDAIVDSAGHLSTLAHETQKEVMAKGREASKVVNHQVHSQPWAYIGGASVVGVVLGYFLARR